jgi:hypothetical protein
MILYCVMRGHVSLHLKVHTNKLKLSDKIKLQKPLKVYSNFPLLRTSWQQVSRLPLLQSFTLPRQLGTISQVTKGTRKECTAAVALFLLLICLLQSKRDVHQWSKLNVMNTIYVIHSTHFSIMQRISQFYNITQ